VDVDEWDELRRRRLAKNERAFRDHNNRRVAFEEQSADADEPIPIVCECGDPDCVDGVEVTVGEYMSAHSAPNRFITRPGHIFPDAERVAQRGDRYWVVDKLILEAGAS
jgi:hypothetical protein